MALRQGGRGQPGPTRIYSGTNFLKPRPVVVHSKSFLPPYQTSTTEATWMSPRAFKCSFPEPRTPRPEPSAFPFLTASGLFLTLPPYTPPLLYATPGSYWAHPLSPPTRGEPTHALHPPKSLMSAQGDCTDNAATGRKPLPSLLTCFHADLHMNASVSFTAHALGSSSSSHPPSKICPPDW